MIILTSLAYTDLSVSFDTLYHISVSVSRQVNVLFASAMTLDAMFALHPRVDLSALAFAYVGGSYISAEAKKRWNGFLSDCGAKVRIVNGYGISEAGGACILADPEREDDAIGRPLSGVKVKIFEEILNNAYMNRSEIPLAMDVFKPAAPEEKELPHAFPTLHPYWEQSLDATGRMLAWFEAQAALAEKGSE